MYGVVMTLYPILVRYKAELAFVCVCSCTVDVCVCVCVCVCVVVFTPLLGIRTVKQKVRVCTGYIQRSTR